MRVISWGYVKSTGIGWRALLTVNFTLNDLLNLWGYVGQEIQPRLPLYKIHRNSKAFPSRTLDATVVGHHHGDRVGHSPPMPNCTNSKASCLATLHRKGGCPVHPRARSWLQYRLTLASSTVLSKSKLPLSNFRAKAVESDRSLTSIPNNSYGTLAKTIKTINWSFLPPSYVYLTWLAMRLPYLLRGLRRIYKGLKHKKSRQKQQFFTKNDRHLYWLWG